MQLGIDFGTCFSSAALANGSTPSPVKDPNSMGFSTPSSVFLTLQNQMLVGKTANNQRLRDPLRYRHEIKRDLGRNTPLLLGHQPFLPETLVAHILRKLKFDADTMARNMGYDAFSEVVITVPTTFSEHKCSLVRSAAQEAGFEIDDVVLLDEPVAAAYYYAQQISIGEGEILLVYDLGGGTFDTALLQRRGKGFEYLAPPTGIERCGGVDFDRAIYNDLIMKHPELQDLVHADRDDQSALLARILIGELCIDLKHQLSEVEESEVSMVVPGVGSLLVHQLTRTAFNGMIAAPLQETIACCQSMLQNANIPWQQIDRILLIGGSCRIPYVQQVLQRTFGRPMSVAPDLELVVCQGAALYTPPPGIAVVSSQAAENGNTTISAALQRAKPGSRIVVQPGIYAESLLLDREIEIHGNGQRDEIIIEATALPCITMQAGSARLSNVTLRRLVDKLASPQNHDKHFSAIHISGGHLILEGCDITSAAGNGITVTGQDANLTLRDSMIRGSAQAGVCIEDKAQGIIEECDIFGNGRAGIEIINSGTNPTINSSKIHDGRRSGVYVHDGALGMVKSCDIFNNANEGISIASEGSNPTVAHCKIYNSRGVGVKVRSGAYGKIEDSEIFNNTKAGVSIADEESAPTIIRCKIYNGRSVGVKIKEGAQGQIENCDIFSNDEQGIVISDGESDPIINNCNIRNNDEEGLFIDIDAHGRIENCDIFGNTSNGVHLSGSNPILIGCKIHDNEDNGIYVATGDNGQGKVDGCDVFGNSSNGVYLNGGDLTVVRCRIHHNEKDGISVFGGEGRIEDGDIFKNIGNGVHVADGDPALVRCQIYKNGNDDLYVSDDVEITLVNCYINDGSAAGLSSSQSSNPQPRYPAPLISPLQIERLAKFCTLSGHGTFVWSVAISANGKVLVTGGHETINVWELPAGKLLHTLTGHNLVLCVAISTDGRTLVSGDRDGTINVWDLFVGNLIHSRYGGVGEGIRGVAINPDGRTFVSGGDDNEIDVRELRTGNLLYTLTGHEDGVGSVAISANGKALVTGGDLTVKVWELQTRKLVRTITTGHTRDISSVAISADGKILVSATHSDTIKVWELPAGKLLHTLAYSTYTHPSIALSIDGQTLFSGGGFEPTIKVWNLRTGKLVRTLTGHKEYVNSIALSADGKTLVSSSNDDTIIVWRA